MHSGDWFENIPKIELHLHLEGAIPLPAMWQVIQRRGPDEVGSFDELTRRFTFKDFAHFIDTWRWKNQFLSAIEDFELIAEAVAEDLKRQRVLYAEVFFSPADFAAHGLQPRAIAEAIRRGLDRVEDITVALIADLVRDYGPDSGAATLEQLAPACEPCGIIGIGIGGSEQTFPPEPFAPVFARARELGLHTNAHAGEAAGASSIWGALTALKVERIGHATRATEDPSLLEHLRQQRIGLEMCPLSNVATAVVDRLADHPLRGFLEQGLLVTVNTDDPMMFGNNLADELRQLHETLGLTRQQVRKLLLNAVDVSWQEPSEKAALRQRMLDDPLLQPK